MSGQDLVVQELDVSDVVQQVEKVQTLMASVMKEGEHFGVIPGTNKPSLLQPGAQKLGLTFRLIPEYKVTRRDLDHDHVEYEIICTLFHQPTGAKMGEGVGSCSSKETKYAYRKGERLCPSCGEAHIIKGKDEYGGGWLCWAKKGGCGAKFADGDQSIEGQVVGQVPNANINDTHNTVLKIAKKRAYVDAMITACAASDLFTQDVEDMIDNGDTSFTVTPVPATEPKAPPNKVAPPSQTNPDTDIAPDLLTMDVPQLLNLRVDGKPIFSLDENRGNSMKYNEIKDAGGGKDFLEGLRKVATERRAALAEMGQQSNSGGGTKETTDTEEGLF